MMTHLTKNTKSFTMGDSESYDEWPSSLPELQEIEEILKCGICHETITTPVLTSCCHAFCSLCVRKWLLNKQVCPICSKETMDVSLRKIPMVENVLLTLKRLKTRISMATGPLIPANSKTSTKLKSPEMISTPSFSKSPLQMLTKSALKPATSSHNSDLATPSFLKGSAMAKTPKIIKKIIVSEDDSTDEDFVPATVARTPKESVKVKKPVVSPKTPLSKTSSANPEEVECPVCKDKYPERTINIHLDKCLLGCNSTRSSNAKSETSVTPSTSEMKRGLSIDNPLQNQHLEPIKKLVYHLFNESQLRKELKKYGLSTQGDKKALTARLQKYVTLFNAECDSSNPRPLVEIKQQLEREEKACISAAPLTSVSQIFKSKQSEEEIEAVHKEYKRQHSASYSKLIKQIQERDKKPETSKSVTAAAAAEESKEGYIDYKSPCGPEVLHIISDSGSDRGNIIKTPQKQKKSRKRKVNYIDSESSSESESASNVKEVHSPVLSSKTPVRQLRSRSAPKPDGQSKPPVRTQRVRKNVKKQPASKKKCARTLTDFDSETIEVVNKEESENNAECVDSNSGNILSPTPDIFSETSSSPASSITCGQSLKKQHRKADDGDALSQLVSLMDGDSSSTTDFEG